MNISRILAVLLTGALMGPACFAQTTASSPATGTTTTAPSPSGPGTSSAPAGAPSAGQMDPNEMMKQMMELAKLNENHKLLADLAGSWNYTVTMWMNPDSNAKPETSKGTAVRKSIMDGRYFVVDVNGKMEMPGPDGKKKEMTFKGTGTEGYDIGERFRGRIVGAFRHHDAGAHVIGPGGDKFLFHVTGEYEAMPGMKQKIRETVKITDKNHHLFEWYEDRGGKEAKTMEIAYTRAKK